ncbi:ABC-type Mn2+/Zn2+ transport system ATPase subunit [Evansella vedderi]|uniref:ABC-type Mn2+/Zn2+ transport system ATPase subunit n=1 Tax=Evansella vedderi TaxID=38282 RepID=A0ABU0A1D3_9BACI|nr:metal ABC transporter ATP-binding protein [Evansella vedderi]MDQ0257298.1 ABC-type Mn2+/Zn2+ transport system ATPase subunit [Evansella vedderi]
MGNGLCLEINQLSVSYHGEKALEDISLSIPAQQLVGIIGPNGAGKSTLIKAILGLIPGYKGKIKVLGKNVNAIRKQIAYVPQRNDVDMDFPVLVEDVVLMGRYPHLSWYGRPKKEDREIALNSLKQVGMLDYHKRQIGELSGGQQQRVFLARALAQEANLFFLDEPFSGIDVTSEKIIIDILRGLRDQGKTLFVVHHDLSKVESYFDSLILLNKRLISCGNSEEVLGVDQIEQAYEGSAVILSGENGKLVVSS